MSKTGAKTQANVRAASHLRFPLPKRRHGVIVQLDRVHVSRRGQGTRALEQTVQLWILPRLRRVPVRFGHVCTARPAKGTDIQMLRGLGQAVARNDASAARARTGVVELLNPGQQAKHKGPIEPVLGARVVDQPKNAQRQFLRGSGQRG